MAEVVQRVTSSTLKVKPILKEKLKSSRTAGRVAFDPEKHLNYVDEPEVILLKDIALPEDLGISPVAVSQPFQLFNDEAIRVMREEILNKEVWDNCLYSTDFAGCQLRGQCPK